MANFRFICFRTTFRADMIFFPFFWSFVRSLFHKCVYVRALFSTFHWVHICLLRCPVSYCIKNNPFLSRTCIMHCNMFQRDNSCLISIRQCFHLLHCRTAVNHNIWNCQSSIEVDLTSAAQTSVFFSIFHFNFRAPNHFVFCFCFYSFVSSWLQQRGKNVLQINNKMGGQLPPNAPTTYHYSGKMNASATQWLCRINSAAEKPIDSWKMKLLELNWFRKRESLRVFSFWPHYREEYENATRKSACK